MEIKIIRFGRYHHAVSGRLLIDGQHVCDTLEQDTGSLPEGEYVMCRNKASALPYYIYSGKEEDRKVFLSMGNGIHGWRHRCIIVGECLHLGFLIRSQEHYDQLLPRLRMQLVRHRPIVVKIYRFPDFVDAA
ncbi:hypothetical protein KSW92_12370 [Prevotella copri]|uniref:DUF5675 family protein n=1 Tax=Segatella copri TaxID=165179 RepID=UPI001C37FF54|nr:DUF5675 family protein [Segatella copri]MBV3430304.1 hypothetical protein [Segatella copri]